MDSNIVFKSNVYPLHKENKKDIKNFCNQVVDWAAIMKINNFFDSTYLNLQQKEVMSRAYKCEYANQDEQTYGIIIEKGEKLLVNRCENYECFMYNECSNLWNYRKIDREEQPCDNKVEIPQNRYIDFGQVDKYINSKKLIENEDNTDYEIERAQIQELDEGTPIEESNYTYQYIPDGECIVNSPLDSKILVNAGPGTGKTYVLIQRLIHLIENNIEPEDILILCYTRTAISEIKKRINEHFNDEEIINRLSIYTFDSFVTQSIIYNEDNTEFLNDKSYDERIEYFLNDISDNNVQEMLCDIKCFMVDELQDLVNVRASLVLKLLNILNCGYLLLGDKCQAIYDYSCQNKNSVNSNQFYEILETKIADEAKCYEFGKNNRQCEELAVVSDEIRQKILHEKPNEQFNFVVQAKNNLEIVKFRLSELNNILKEYITSDKTLAILCRNNGEVSRISGMLCAKRIKHNMLMTSRNDRMYNRWIADVFWDYSTDIIQKDEFIERLKIRANIDDGEKYWRDLCDLTESQEFFINITQIRKVIMTEQILPDYFYINNKSNITVSTIHKAKGREFDSVLLLLGDYSKDDKQAEESRIAYVGFTRPKEKLKLAKYRPWYMKNNNNSHWVRLTTKYGRKFATMTSLGLEGDVNYRSFVYTDNNIEIQKYIANEINVYDLLQIKKENDTYAIYHNDTKLGCINNGEKLFLNIIRLGSNRNRLPDRIEDIYVNNIVSVIDTSFDDKVTGVFKNSHIWLGVEICGFAHMKWRTK